MIIAHLRRRLNERSTWLQIIAGVTAAAALPSPFNMVALGLSVCAALVPDGNVK